MAGQGSLCHETLSARWMIVAFGLRSKFWLSGFFAFLLAASASAIDPPADTEPADNRFSPTLIVRSDSDEPTSETGSTMSWSAQVQSLSKYQSTRMVIRACMLRTGDGKEISSQRRIVPVDSNGNSDVIEFPFELPQDAGVIEFRFELSVDDRRVWSRFVKPSEPIESLGRPVYVVQSPIHQDASAQENDPPLDTRIAWLLVNDRSWNQALADQAAQRPANDTHLFSQWEPTTLAAINAWNAVEQIKRTVDENGFVGVQFSASQSTDNENNAGNEITAGNQTNTGNAAVSATISPSDESSLSNIVVDLLTAAGVKTVVKPMATSGLVDLTKLTCMKQDLADSVAPYAKLSMASVLATSDPTELVVHLPFDEPSIAESVRNTLRTYQRLPNRPMNSVASIDAANKTVRVRSGVAEGHGFVAVLNLAPWTNRVDIQFAQPSTWAVIDDPSPPASIRESAGDSSRHQLTLGPGQLVLLKSQQSVDLVTVSSWTATVAGGMNEIQRIKGDVTAVVERIGLLSDLAPSGSLSNGGFERAGGLGLIGWMHAQHPPGCVRLDDQESAEGRQSILLTTDPTMSARTWIVSETLPPSPSGKMAVSLITRAERRSDNSTHPIRVSLEATRDGEPIRYSSDYAVPCNGSWGSRQIVLEIDGVEKQSVDSMRLTIDSLAAGRLWIDDIRIHYQFPTKRERDDIQSQAFLAVQGLQHGDLTPSARLLQNPWARKLLANHPRQEAHQVQANQASETTPGVAERIRSLLPRPIRF